jgi:RNA polymerase sigma-70 factor (ECF subfamily)
MSASVAVARWPGTGVEIGWPGAGGSAAGSGGGRAAGGPLVRPVAETPEASCPATEDALMGILARRDAAAEAALAVLYERYAGAVYGLGVRMLGDGAAAEEVLQEAFWRVWRYAGNYEPGRVRFITWLLRIATNLAISEQRKRARRPRTCSLTPPVALGESETEHGAADVVDPDPDVPEQVWLGEQRRAVTAALATLPPTQRQAVELAYFGGLTHAQIAARQGAPLSTVKTRLALGLRKLADFLNGTGVRRGDCLS